MISEHASPLGGIDAGGQNTHVAELARALAERGHEVRVYTRRDDPDAPDTVRLAAGVTVEHVPAGPASVLPTDEQLPFVGGFGRWLADRWSTAGGFRPDVVHAHSWMSGLAALTATAKTRLPVVVTFHALGSVTRRHHGSGDTGLAHRLGLERTLGRRADRVLAQCAEEADELVRMGVPRTSVHIVPSGVDTDRFTPSGPAKPRTGALRRILGVGQLDERKGHDELIRALRRVPNAEVVIAGGPPSDELDADPQARRLHAVASRAGVADRVRLLGSVPAAEMPAWYRSADLVCCPPWYDPFGMTSLEAMACGVPVVTYAVGGPAESVIDGVTGVHVPPRDVSGLATTLRGLLADDMRRISYASAAVDRVRSRYTWPRAALDVERVYEGVARTGSLTEVPG